MDEELEVPAKQESEPEVNIEGVDFEKETGLHIITIVYDDDGNRPPSLHLAGTNPWVAYSILAAAMESLEIVRPALTITYEGNTIFAPEMLILGDDDEDYDED